MPKIVHITRQAMPYVPGDRPSLPERQADALVRTGFARDLTEEERAEIAALAAAEASPADKRGPAQPVTRR